MSYTWQELQAVAAAYAFDLTTPFGKLTKEQQNVILFGSKARKIKMQFSGRNNRVSSIEAPFEGVIPNLERRFRETNSE